MTICFYDNSENGLILWTAALAVFTFILAVATIFLVNFTKKLFQTADKELKALVETSKSDFLFRLKQEFFTDKMALYVMLIDRNLLTYIDANTSYFQVKKDILLERYKIEVSEDNITPYQLDNALLYHLEAIGYFVKDNGNQNSKLIFEDVYELFRYYVESCGKNEEIMKYINSQRQKDKHVYSNLIELYKRCIAITENENNNKSLS